jgi:probable HAF family extracellular repeat protein
MVALPTLDGRYSRASDINDHGLIVGSAEVSGSPDFHAVAWSRTDPNTPWTITDLGTLPGFPSSAANAVNKHGVVVGMSYMNNFSSGRGFVYDGSMTMLPSLGGALSTALDINKHGVIVGWSFLPAPGGRRAVMWTSGGIVDLNTLLPAGSGWNLTSASSINDNGDIVGTGVDPNGMIRGFVLTRKPGKG